MEPKPEQRKAKKLSEQRLDATIDDGFAIHEIEYIVEVIGPNWPSAAKAALRLLFDSNNPFILTNLMLFHPKLFRRMLAFL